MRIDGMPLRAWLIYRLVPLRIQVAAHALRGRPVMYRMSIIGHDDGAITVLGNHVLIAEGMFSGLRFRSDLNLVTDHPLTGVGVLDDDGNQIDE